LGSLRKVDACPKIGRVDPGSDARKLLRSRDFGVLATQSRELPGYPFGSITPYALDDQGVPLLLIASIAQHTKNIVADARVSLTVWEEGRDDPQAGARLTWMADASQVPDGDSSPKARYARRFPSSAAAVEGHDFALYRLQAVRARFIGGFGSIHWVAAAAMHSPGPPLSGEAGILAHMNEGHPDALLQFCKAFKNVAPRVARMVGIDPAGFEVLADSRRLRFEFDEPVRTADEARKAMVALVRAAKGPAR
jgi:putative heme iron utilization protein